MSANSSFSTVRSRDIATSFSDIASAISELSFVQNLSNDVTKEADYSTPALSASTSNHPCLVEAQMLRGIDSAQEGY